MASATLNPMDAPPVPTLRAARAAAAPMLTALRAANLPAEDAPLLDTDDAWLAEVVHLSPPPIRTDRPPAVVVPPSSNANTVGWLVTGALVGFGVTLLGAGLIASGVLA